jgi:NAD(P)-dependent dehydrogenase (short-subunit alcohol dehydrogenase family)
MAKLTAITGGGGGIGLATAHRLLVGSHADRVVLIDRDRSEPAAELLEGEPERVSFVTCDVTDPDGVRSTFEEIDAIGVPLTGLVNGAGIVDNSASVDLEFETWRKVLAVHLDGAFLCSQEAGRRMIDREAGSIVNLGSIAGLFGHPRRLPYSVAKAAIHQLTRTLAAEWGTLGVRVNSVAPGFVATPLVEEVTRLGLIDAEAAASLHAMKRLGRPEEVADAIAYLLSDQASFITGETLRVDGGFSVLKVE